MKIASWNVNSLRVRLPQVLSWLKKSDIDILAIQETKVEDGSFPIKEIEEAGFFCDFVGQKTYNGVTTISKIPPKEVIKSIDGKEQEQKRILLTRYKDDLNFIKKDLKKTKYYLILGDFNIAPKDVDIYDPKAWEGKILCSDKERSALKEILDLGFKDSFRLFDQEKDLYSWWDYRTGAFRRNRGLRIDLILTNMALSKKCSKSLIDIEPRKNERPSDHAPVVSIFDI